MTPRKGLEPDWSLSLLGAALLSAVLFWLASHQVFDYDEISDFHAVWQVMQGHRPYVDVSLGHPPYFWLPFCPLLRRLPEDFRSLLLLRRLNLFGSWLALALFLRMLLGLYDHPKWKACALGACALVVLQVPVAFTLAQFRADHLCLALSLAGLWLLDAGGRPRPARWAAVGALFAAAALLTPKLALLYAAALLVFGFDLWRAEPVRAPACALAFAAGAAACGLCLNALSLAAGADPRPFFQQVLGFYLRGNLSPGYRFGLARGLLLRAAFSPLWLLLFLAGAFASAQALRADGWRRHKLLVVLLAFACLQPVWVKYPWNQYLYTVLLFWALPLAIFLFRLEGWPRWGQGAAGLLLLSGVYLAIPDITDYERGHRGLEEQIADGNRLLAWSAPGRPVSVQPPAHPVFRENSTYFFGYGFTPGGPDNEDQLQGSEFGRHFSYAGYLEELQRRPPSLILVDPVFSGKRYRRAVDDYVHKLHAGEYEERPWRGSTVLVRRPGR